MPQRAQEQVNAIMQYVYESASREKIQANLGDPKSLGCLRHLADICVSAQEQFLAAQHQAEQGFELPFSTQAERGVPHSDTPLSYSPAVFRADGSCTGSEDFFAHLEGSDPILCKLLGCKSRL